MGFLGGGSSVAVGSVTTVWDREIAGVWLVLESVTVSLILVLSDSQAVIASVRSAAPCGLARTGDLRAVVDLVGTCTSAVVPIRFAYVKLHMGVAGNKTVDEMAKLGCIRGDALLVTEVGVRALWKRVRAAEYSVVGCGMGRVARWGRRAVSHYN